MKKRKELNLSEELGKIYGDYSKGKFDGLVFIKKVKEAHKNLTKRLKEEIDRLKVINNGFCQCQVKFKWYKQLNERLDKLTGDLK